MEDIHQQIGELRASIRRQRAFNLMLVCALVTAVFVAASRPSADGTFETVKCHRLTITDQAGKSRVLIGTSESDSTFVSLRDGNGEGRALLAATAEGVALGLQSKSGGQGSLSLRVNAAGDSDIRFKDDASRNRLVLSSRGDTTGWIVTDSAGRERIAAAVSGVESVLPTADILGVKMGDDMAKELRRKITEQLEREATTLPKN